jgi:hypothetical protein
MDRLIEDPVLLIALFLVALALFIIAVIWMISILRRPGDKPPDKKPETGTQGTVQPPPPNLPVGSSYLQLIDAAGNAWPLEPLPVNIGRDAQRNSIVLVDDKVSANHARIFYDDVLKVVCIEDSNSLNGIYIEEHPTLKNTLHDGVKIRFGDTTFTYRDMGYIPPTSNGTMNNRRTP